MFLTSQIITINNMINNKQIQGFLIPYDFFKLQFLNPLMHNVPKWSDTL